MTPESTTTEPRPLRSDAARNRARVLEAALEVFGEQGLDAPIPEVAARAGVGKATIYRSYPTREHLVGAIVVHQLDQHEAQTREALEAPDAWEAFCDLLYASAEKKADRTFAACLAATIDLPEVIEARRCSSEAMDELMTRAQAQGRMRPGITSADLRVLYSGAGRILDEAGTADPVQWRRYIGLLIDAFRAEGEPAQPLVG